MTETELTLMAAAAIIGLSSSLKNGKNPGRHGHAEGVVDEGEEEVLLDVPDRRLAETPRPDDSQSHGWVLLTILQ
jgi:hypothetical protein